MPRTNREYLLRYADQAIDDLENALGRLKLLSDAYGGVIKPMAGPINTATEKLPDTYDTPHGKYQQYVDLVAAQVMAAKHDLTVFRKNHM